MSDSQEEKSSKWSLRILNSDEMIIVIVSIILMGIIYGIYLSEVFTKCFNYGEYIAIKSFAFYSSIIAYFILGTFFTIFLEFTKEKNSIIKSIFNLGVYNFSLSSIVYLIELSIFTIIIASKTNQGIYFFSRNLLLFLIICIGNVVSFISISAIIIYLFSINNDKKGIRKSIMKNNSINMDKPEIIEEYSMIAQEERFCMICKLEIRPGQEFTQCPYCFAPFHRNHFITWLEKHDNCPVCNRQLKF
ncbi:MAG: hypothetical protein EU542_08250 [Promethearchaeota archaeon]|nr:MAG: hypothetical protein EU542_08250 [Candidatus Lokiarchaeota archaeon]